MLTKIGMFLRKLRIDHGEILKTMAEKLDVSSSFLSAVENGKKKMPSSWNEFIPDLYSFTREQRLEFQRAIMETEDMLELNLNSLSLKQKEAAFSFARKIEDLSDAELDLLNKFFEQSKKKEVL